MSLETLSSHPCFGGTVGFYRHDSTETQCQMRFSVFAPPLAREQRVPVLYYLAGLTCTEETFMIKAGAQRVAAELGLMLVAPDTSPRGVSLPGDRDSWDFGVGAGFYLDATQEPCLATTECIPMSQESCPCSSRQTSRWIASAWEFSGIPWEGMAR